jgi:hypothetical protein
MGGGEGADSDAVDLSDVDGHELLTRAHEVAVPGSSRPAGLCALA